MWTVSGEAGLPHCEGAMLGAGSAGKKAKGLRAWWPRLLRGGLRAAAAAPSPSSPEREDTMTKGRLRRAGAKNQ